MDGPLSLPRHSHSRDENISVGFLVLIWKCPASCAMPPLHYLEHRPPPNTYGSGLYPCRHWKKMKQTDKQKSAIWFFLRPASISLFSHFETIRPLNWWSTIRTTVIRDVILHTLNVKSQFNVILSGSTENRHQILFSIKIWKTMTWNGRQEYGLCSYNEHFWKVLLRILLRL